MFCNNIKLLYTFEPVQSDGKDDKKSVTEGNVGEIREISFHSVTVSPDPLTEK